MDPHIRLRHLHSQRCCDCNRTGKSGHPRSPNHLRSPMVGVARMVGTNRRTNAVVVGHGIFVCAWAAQRCVHVLGDASVSPQEEKELRRQLVAPIEDGGGPIGTLITTQGQTLSEVHTEASLVVKRLLSVQRGDVERGRCTSQAGFLLFPPCVFDSTQDKFLEANSNSKSTASGQPDTTP